MPEDETAKAAVDADGNPLDSVVRSAGTEEMSKSA